MISFHFLAAIMDLSLPSRTWSAASLELGAKHLMDVQYEMDLEDPQKLQQEYEERAYESHRSPNTPHRSCRRSCRNLKLRSSLGPRPIQLQVRRNFAGPCPKPTSTSSARRSEGGTYRARTNVASP